MKDSALPVVEEVENVILGTGEAGKFLAWSLGKAGERVVVIERKPVVGGACPNVACLPTKRVVALAKMAQAVREAGRLGVVKQSAVGVDMGAVIARKREMVADLQKLHLEKFAASGAEIVFGEGRFVGPRTFEVKLLGGGVRRIRGKRVFLNVGSRAAMPEIPGLREAGAMTHVEALELEEVPGHLVVVGGGYVGLEFAQAYRRFGAEVTVVARAGRLLEREDADVSEGVAKLMEDEGVKVALGVNVVRVEGRSGERVRMHLSNGTVLDATHVLVATGRVMNTDTFDAAAGGVRLRANRTIEVNEKLETSADGVWAMGECAGSPQFTHVSFDDHRVVFENVRGGKRTTAGRLVPYVLFTDPEVAHVGMTEAEAKASGVRHVVTKVPAKAFLRTWTQGEQRGFVKVIVEAEKPNRILGFTAFCIEASEILAAVQTAMLTGASYTVLRDATFAHPTLSEGLEGLFERVVV